MIKIDSEGIPCIISEDTFSLFSTPFSDLQDTINEKFLTEVLKELKNTIPVQL